MTIAFLLCVCVCVCVCRIYTYPLETNPFTPGFSHDVCLVIISTVQMEKLRVKLASVRRTQGK